MKFISLLFVVFLISEVIYSQNPLSLDNWTYFQLDDERTKHPASKFTGGGWFGLDAGDLNGDGYIDIASGKWIYLNPGGDFLTKWNKKTISDSIDALMITDIDGDETLDIIGLQCNKQFWIEAKNNDAGNLQIVQFGNRPICNHGVSSQGFTTTQIIPGGKKEILINSSKIFCFSVPEEPEKGDWPFIEINENPANGEGIGTGDMDGDGDIDVIAALAIRDKENNPAEANIIAWFENEGKFKDEWKQHIIGSTYHHSDKIIVCDMNGDKRNDVVVTEERFPGTEPDANLFWFESFASNDNQDNWIRHTITTTWSLNSLDVADIDQDGDQDLVTCEHKGQELKLMIFCNDGMGNMTQITIDKGKESHGVTRLADMDNDGDLDIISIAWLDFRFLNLWRNNAITSEPVEKETPPLGLCNDFGQKYYLPVEINTGEYERKDKPASVDLNFTPIMKKLKIPGDFNTSSIYVVETDREGNIIDPLVVFQFDKDSLFNPLNNAKGNLVFIMKGYSRAETTRFYRIYFDNVNINYITPLFPKQTVINTYYYKYQSTAEVKTPGGIYYFQEWGAGFSDLYDPEGNNWITYQPYGGSAGEYRGIPNISPAGFHPGAGDNLMWSKQTAIGPIRFTIFTESKDHKWACKWDIYPHYAVMTLLKTDGSPYWFLYEGTPGGELDKNDYWVRSDGVEFSITKDWAGDLPDPEWIYFGDKLCHYILYIVNHQEDNHPDQYWSMESNMTVFGFGREYRCCGTYMTAVPAMFTIGLSKSGQFVDNKNIIEAAYKPLDTTIGDGRKNIN